MIVSPNSTLRQVVSSTEPGITNNPTQMASETAMPVGSQELEIWGAEGWLDIALPDEFLGSNLCGQG
jgi:hypothetical protein